MTMETDTTPLVEIIEPARSPQSTQNILRRRASIQLALLAHSNGQNQYYRRAQKDWDPYINIANSASPLRDHPISRDDNTATPAIPTDSVTNEIRPSLSRSVTATASFTFTAPSAIVRDVSQRRVAIGRNPATYSARRSSIASSMTDRTSLFPEGDLVTRTLSRPPTYAVEPATGVQTTVSPTASIATSTDVECQQHLRHDRVGALLHNRYARGALIIWCFVLIAIGGISFVVPAMHAYIIVLWMPLVLTIGVAVVLCAERGRRANNRAWEEQMMREAEAERVRRQRELPEGHFFIIDERAQRHGHGHPVVTLLPPPPKYGEAIENMS